MSFYRSLARGCVTTSPALPASCSCNVSVSAHR